jgi:hypothetical protein
MNPTTMSRGPEVTAEPGALSRREALIRMGSAAMLTLGAVPFVIGATARKAAAQGTLTPAMIEALNTLILADYVTEIFYQVGLDTSGLIPAADVPVFQQLLKQESGHVVTMNNTLSGNAREKPGLDFTGGGAYPEVFSDYATYLSLAQAFEDLTVRLYKGQLGAFTSNGLVLTTLLRIHSVEGRHAAMLRRLRGQKPWIEGAATDLSGFAAVYTGEDNASSGMSAAFDEPITADSALNVLDPFLV